MARVPALVFCAFAGLGLGASSPLAASQLRATSLQPMRRGGTSLDFQHLLRICNVYPYDAAVDVYLGKKKLNEAELAYKDCAEVSTKLDAGAKLDFKVAEVTVGTFTILDPPQSDAVLFVAMFRHDATSTAVSFESHVFAVSEQPQVAVVDTYKSRATSEFRIDDKNGTKKEATSGLRINDQNGTKEGEVRSELLRYGSVVSVTPGVYDLVLTKSAGEKAVESELIAKKHEAYVVLRCGLAASADGVATYPEDLVVFPRSDPAEFEKDKGGASTTTEKDGASTTTGHIGVLAVLASVFSVLY